MRAMSNKGAKDAWISSQSTLLPAYAHAVLIGVLEIYGEYP
jgi:hypothetical protein